MKNISARSLDAPQGDAQVPLYLTTKPRQESKALRWWYRIASPPAPRSAVSFQEMERFRRGRTGSQIILGLYFLLIISIPAGFIGTNIYLIPIVIGTSFALLIATALNRLGKVNAAGVIVVLAFIAFPIINIVTTPGGLSMLVLPLYGLLVLPLLCAVSFLPPWWVFVVALGNSLFTLYSLTSLPRTAELSAILAIAFAGIMTPIILSQVIVSVVAYAWVQSTTQALVRADRAEELAKLEHDMARQAEEAAQQRRQLEASIQKIVETHMRVANGDFSARVPLTQDNVLLQISGSLNNLLARAQRLRQDSNELQQVKLALQQARDENGRLRTFGGKNVSRGL
jgi:HAMP domain-containing protein